MALPPMRRQSLRFSISPVAREANYSKSSSRLKPPLPWSLLLRLCDSAFCHNQGLTAMTRAFDGVGTIEADGGDRGASSPSSPSPPPSNRSVGGADGELLTDRHQTMEPQEQQPESVPAWNGSHDDGSQSLSSGSSSHGVGVVESSLSSGSSSSRRVDTAASGFGDLYGNFAEEDVAVFECQVGKKSSSLDLSFLVSSLVFCTRQ